LLRSTRNPGEPGAVPRKEGRRPGIFSGIVRHSGAGARDKRPPFSKADAEAIKTPTLFIGGANTKSALPHVLHTLAAHVRVRRR